MFHGRDTGTGFIVSGIYQYIDSPMYGLGNIQMCTPNRSNAVNDFTHRLTLTDGLALMGNDWMALLIALAFHISIFAFNVLVEQPFVKKTYGGGTNGATNTSNSLFDEEDKMSNQI
jgi:hypothetical protein